MENVEYFNQLGKVWNIDVSHLLDLFFRYSEPHRHYHNFDHIITMLRNYKSIVERPMIEHILAILYHDAVYQPGRDDNESLSANLYRMHYEENPKYDREISYRVEGIISATKLYYGYFPTAIPENYWPVLDADLAGLGSDPYTYFENGRKIWQEFKFSSNWKEGQIKFIEKMLDRQFIYYTEKARILWERMARENLKSELENLSS